MNIEGKVAVITGGASGLGRATAEMIIANGGKVAILDLNEDLANATANDSTTATTTPLPRAPPWIFLWQWL